MKELEKIKQLISSTPMVDIKYKYNNQIKHAYCKCEWYSITGSIKDKTAYQILLDAYSNGNLTKGSPIVEVSSGNMGISLTALARFTDNPVTIIMPKHMSEERKKLLRLYGATLVETNDFPDAFNLAKEYAKNGYFYPRQFENISNAHAHATITAQEILLQTKDKNINTFVCGIGTSGTFSGIGRTLKKERNMRVTAIEPYNARIVSSPPPYRKHKLQGLSDEILPKLYDTSLCDDIIQIKDDDAIAMAQKLCKELSLGVGISSGANFLGAVLSENNAVTIFPDDNKKYLSTDLCNPISTPLVDTIDLLNFDVLTI